MQDVVVKTKSERISPPLSSLDSLSTPSTPTPRPTGGPQLIGHLSRAEEVALKTFTQISDNVYQYRTLGLSRQADEGFTCDCTYEPGIDEPYIACGEGSDCINRLTQVECLEDDCHCRSYCQNQRFQKKQYTPFHIVQTEMKGFGLRAAVDIPKDAFIYEYIGEVVSHPSFAKRMREYAEEGIRHFYFMMLQKDEYIDATKKGDIGRFANHSCNPNCFVAKWTVGKKVRMGIFAKRKIKKDEELTFNYNVDRYGHDPQPCYCGEPQCVGVIGGKTQTDIAAMDDIVLDALGMTDDVELLGLKGNKKKKGKKLDEDFTPVLKPLVEKDVVKVLQALRQTSNRKLLVKLLTRIKKTEDQVPLRQLMRLRGLSVMSTILQDHVTDMEISTLVVESLFSWPLISRNKVADSRVEVPLRQLISSENETIRGLSEKLLKHWEPLELTYRIPKRVTKSEENGDGKATLIVMPPSEEERPAKRIRFGEQDTAATLAIKPLGFSNTTFVRGSFTPSSMTYTNTLESRSTKPSKKDLAAIIAAATVAAANVASSSTPPTLPEDESKQSSKPKKISAAKLKATKEQRLLKLVGPVVVKCMSKYQTQFEHDTFKKHAKTLTHLIAEKEKKSSSYEKSKLDSLSDEKKDKIKKFVKEYVSKLIKRKGKLKEKDGRTSSTQERQEKFGGHDDATNKEENADGDDDHPNSPEDFDMEDGSPENEDDIDISIEIEGDKDENLGLEEEEEP
ncbi:hypothetical protein Clacol_003590 [Clathrus columnatus]|uniref:Histone-lysine N-methyltransferase, H3 lysine-36 specific n=1 Tax=Clathrus columnatus TaxID=1419009 RepID=A0AAV5A839_9AGAM|nr:hypothetical protein Clacol_003590 [Clathrus columnatus]